MTPSREPWSLQTIGIKMSQGCLQRDLVNALRSVISCGVARSAMRNDLGLRCISNSNVAASGCFKAIVSSNVLALNIVDAHWGINEICARVG